MLCQTKFWIGTLAFLSLGPTALGAAAQLNEPARFLGFSIGGGEAPATLIDGCVGENRFHKSESSMLAELRAGLPLGPVVLESRTTMAGRALTGGIHDCFSSSGPIHKTGVHVDRLRGVEARSFTATDLRVRIEGISRLPLTASFGGGRVWREDVAFFLASAGLRSRGRWRGAVDLEWTTYRMPFDVVSQEWENGTVVQELEREREYEWQRGWSIRIGVEYHIR